MELHCETVKDLLPGYADDLVAVNTRTAVDAHLRTCDDCRRYLESLRGSERNVAAALDSRKESLQKKNRPARKALVSGGTVEDQMYMPRAVNATLLPPLTPSKIPAGTPLNTPAL